MKKYLVYLKYIIFHKWFVFLECCKEGIIWRGIVHDLSKLRISEFIPYANFFEKSKQFRDETGYYKPIDTGDKAFDYAWLLHQKRNKHHWQWWILPEDENGFKVLEMPEKYVKEMLCDWKGAGRAQKNKITCKEWYLINKNKMMLHENTKRSIKQQLL